MTDSEQESCLLCNRDSSVEGGDHLEDNCQFWIFAPRSAKESGLLVSTKIFFCSAGAVVSDGQLSSLLILPWIPMQDFQNSK